MYEKFFGFREKPFSLIPDASFLYFGKQHGSAVTMLEYGLANESGITVITGEVGCGKTTLIRHMLEHADPSNTIGLISNTHPSFGELMKWVLLAFNLEHRDKDSVESYQVLTEFLIDEYAQSRRAILVVDEAQNLGPESIEELRMLTNINADKHMVLQLILIGQPELRETLRQPDLKQFVQRVAADYHIEPLDEDDASKYISHRIKVAGGDPNIFESQSLPFIFRYSGGIPRYINLLCDMALVYAYGSEQRSVSAEIVIKVAQDKAIGGLFELANVDDLMKAMKVGDQPVHKQVLDQQPLDQQESSASTGDKQRTKPATPSATDAIRDTPSYEDAIEELKSYLERRGYS
ncbi:MAG: AAA family ATPase [Gammaproteobacteria bacterium]|nr:AAA family ATPase [Gammaproteobacteria bacterium]MDH3464613.1 AAA family ATPase [Gammaproteobacteria bacterium]